MTIFLAMISLLATGLPALDNTIVNSFWNTTGYTNAVPVQLPQTVTTAVDAAVPHQVEVTILDFNSHKPGLLLYVR